ncbi:MAG: hypothetical protein Q4P15_07475 [Propionibacteriaceae bacterium]|nr:hypothetical protein [Propionibacteriaceae bacterium]
MPINTGATEQRLIEELTGSRPPLEEPADADLREPGDPDRVDDDVSDATE